MIRLDTVNRSLTLVLGGAQITAPLQIVVSYSDQTSSTYLGSTQLANSNGTTAVTICSAPVGSVIRDIDMVTVLNTDSASQTVTIQLLDTATTYKIITVTLLVGDKLTYTHGSAWQVVNNSGNIKYSVLSSSGVDSFSGGSTGLTPATATTGAVTLGGTLAVASGGTGTATPALVAGTNVTITGTWPNQTVNATSSGTVTSVAALTLGTTGTDVSSTVANSTTTPVITLNLPTASATNRGALSAADWTTFNSKGSGTVTSVTGTAPVVSSGGTTPAISMAAATTSADGYLTSTDWNTFNGKGSGTVTSVSGTTGRITSTGGTTPVLDLTSGIATPGTTGSASLIPVVTIDTYGRVTSITTAANPQGTVTSVTGTSPISSSGGATPAISLAAATASVNGYLTSTDWTTFNSKGSGSVTSVAATVPTFLSVTGSPITTSGTLAISYSGTALPIANGGSGEITAQLAMNAFAGAVTSGSYLRGNGTNVVMATIQAADVPTLNQNTTGTASNVTGTVAVANGGTGLTTTPANGALDIGNGTGFTRATLTAGTGISVTNASGSITIAATNSGTVTSVTGTSPVLSSGGATPAISLAASYGDTQNPYASKTANYVLAAPDGTAGVPTFRAVVAADIPTLNQNTTGTAANVTGTVAIANGGSGQITAQLAMNAFAGAVTSGSYLRGNGVNVVMAAIQAGDVPTLNQNTTGNAATATSATTATNIAGGTNLQIPFNTGAGATSFIVAPTVSSTFLQYNGTGFTWAASTGVGTVTSVAATVPSFLSITGSPITTVGTLAISYSGTALPIANGGTGQTTAGAAFNALSPITTTGDLILGNGTNSATRLGIGANGYVLTSNGTTASWAAGGGGGSLTISNDTTTASNLYPSFFAATSGTASTVFTSDAKLLYKPSTGEFQSSIVNANNGIFVNSATISTSYTIATGTNGASYGPISVSTGVTVTVETDSVWTIN
jgi:hypothetical protein